MIFAGAAAVLFALLWSAFYYSGPVALRMINSVAHKTASYRYGDYLGVILLLAIGLFVSIQAGDGFLDLAELLTSQSPELKAADSGVHRWAEAERSPGATMFFNVMTTVGAPIGLAIIVTIVAGFLLTGGRYRWVAYLLITNLAGALMIVRLKIFFARERPDLAAAIRHAHGYSFPSGHSMGSTIAALSLAYLVSRTQWPWRLKSALIAALITFMLSVAFSRIYLGVHWVSDVAAGLSAGTLWVTVTTVAYETVRRVRKVRSRRAAARPPA